MTLADDDLASSVAEARQVPRFCALWDEGSAPTRAFAAACLALVDLSERTAPERASVYERIATEPRAAVLALLGPGRGLAESVKTIERCDAPAFARNDWTTLFEQLAQPKTRRALAHMPVVTSTLVRQIPLVPESFRRPALFMVISQLAVDAEHWRQFATAVDEAGPDRLAGLLRGGRAIKTAADFWALFHRCLDAARMETMSRRGPVVLGEQFEPLIGTTALRREGQRMTNCLGRLTERAARGQSSYFAWLGAPRATVELVAVAGSWVLGEIGVAGNAPLPAETETSIRASIAASLGAAAVADRREAAGRVRGAAFEHCMAVARAGFTDRERAEVADALWSLHGRSLSPTEGAFAIVEARKSESLYFQCLADPGSNYFVEISSHWYAPAMSSYLTSAAVRLLDDSGFEWPRKLANFKRLFHVASRSDCEDLADFALGALHELFGVHPEAELNLKVHVPVGAGIRAANEQLAAILESPS